MNLPERRNPWLWVPSLYFAEGLPYVVALTVSVIMYKRLGISNTDIALYTSLLYLPWVIKPFWAPIVDMVRTKRLWILMLQLALGVSLAAVAVMIPAPGFFRATLLLFWLMAFSSATHDIAADGFYMLALEEHEQAVFVGVRSTFYRIAMVTGQGLLVIVAGTIEIRSGGNTAFAWSVTFGILAVMFLLFFAYHRFILPVPAADVRVQSGGERSPVAEFFRVFVAFFDRPHIKSILAFLLLYRFAEAQLIKLVSPFLLDPRVKGGLGLTTSDVGVVYGTVGIIALTLGGLAGGFVIPRRGLRFWLWPMVIIMHLPDLAFVYLSRVQPENFVVINAAVAVEQFGYGFGFTAYSLYMIMVSGEEHKTAHYAICTGIMALGMMIPGMFSGALQEWLGYRNFYIWVMLSTIPGFVVTALISIDRDFGRKSMA
jgi:PAT family beta-lactamase induction signal transducer AmpG